MPEEHPSRELLQINHARFLLAKRRLTDVLHHYGEAFFAGRAPKVARELAYAYYRLGKPSRAARVLRASFYFREEDEVACQLYGQAVSAS